MPQQILKSQTAIRQQVIAESSLLWPTSLCTNVPIDFLLRSVIKLAITVDTEVEIVFLPSLRVFEKYESKICLCVCVFVEIVFNKEKLARKRNKDG